MADDWKVLGKWSELQFDVFITLSLLLLLKKEKKNLIVIKLLWAQTLDFSGLGHMDEAEREALATRKLLKVKTHKSQVMGGAAK